MKKHANNTQKRQSAVEYLMWAQDQRYASKQLYEHNAAQPTTSTMLTKDAQGNIRLLNGSNSALQNMPYGSSMELNVVNAINIVNSQSYNSILPTYTQKYELIHRVNEKKMILDAADKLDNHANLVNLITKLVEFKTEYLYQFQQETTGIRDRDSFSNCLKITIEEQSGINWLRSSLHLKAEEFLKSDYVKKLGIEVVFHENQDENRQNDQPQQDGVYQEQQNNDEEEAEMIRQLQAQLEQMRQERDHAIGQRDDARGQVAQQEQVITEQNTRLTQFSNSMSQLAQLQQRLTQEREQMLRNIDEANQRADNIAQERDAALEQVAERDRVIEDRDRIIEERDQTITDLTTQNTELANTVTEREGTIDNLNIRVQGLEHTVTDKDNQLHAKDEIIEGLNNTIHDLQQNQNNDERIVDLTHRLEIITIQKEAVEHTVIDRDREIARLTENINDLREDVREARQDKAELRAANKIVNDEKTELNQAKNILEGRVDDLNHQIDVSKLFIKEVKGHYENHEVAMSGCNNCHAYQHHIDWSPFE